MGKPISCFLNLQDPCLYSVIKHKVDQLPPGYKCALYPEQNKVLPSINGEYFNVISMNGEEYDTAMLEKKHFSLSIKDLSAFGILYRIENEMSDWDFMNFGINPTGGDTSIETSIEFGQRDFNGKDQNEVHKKIINYLNNDHRIEILDDGKQEYTSYAFKLDGNNTLDMADASNWEITAHDFMEIWITINVGKPNVVSELESTARKVKQEIETMLSYYINF